MFGFRYPFCTHVDPMHPAVNSSAIAWFAALKARGEGDGISIWEMILFINIALTGTFHKLCFFLPSLISKLQIKYR